METRTLYIYNSVINNKIRRTVTLTRSDLHGEFLGTSYRLVADPGKVLTDGVTQTSCIDTDEPSKWAEIDEPEESNEQEPS